jgi:2-polyprenyl-6-methoxyphenol hydroxylase-like FAD-dependent oxidoreductase
MQNKNILIAGAGIAGTTLAYWLQQFGYAPTIVEQAPQVREGGYAIDFWGAGFDVAEKMCIVPELQQADVGIAEVAFVDAHNQRKAAMNYRQIKKMMNGRALTLLRSDLAKVIYHHLDPHTEILFGQRIAGLQQHDEGVDVTFSNGQRRLFDLVVGADGLHSSVRHLVFGSEAQFESYYGYYTASFTIETGVSAGTSFLTYNVPGKQAAVYSLGEHKAAAFFIFRAPEKLAVDHHDIEQQKAILRQQFGDAGWKCPELLAKMDAATDFYFDVVSQIDMKRWSKDRVSLVGDACDCPSLLSGQGSTLAMVGAYILAGELKEAGGNYQRAFAQYEHIFKPFISRKQRIAQNFARSLVPDSQFGIWKRNFFTRLMALPVFTKMFIRQFSDQDLKLADYRDARG